MDKMGVGAKKFHISQQRIKSSPFIFQMNFFYNFIDEIGSHLVNENKYESWVELHISLMLAGVIHIFSST